MLESDSCEIEVKGHVGTWSVVDSAVYADERIFLLEHEEYGDEAACIIVDGNGVLLLSDVYNGFLDYEEFMGY